MAQKNSAEGAKVNEKGLGSFSAFYSHIMNRRGMAPRPSAGRNMRITIVTSMAVVMFASAR